MNTNNFDTAPAEKKLSAGLLCAVATAFVVYIAVFPLMPMTDLFGMAALLVFTGVYSLIFTKKSVFALIVPPAAAITAVTVTALVDSGFTVAVGLRYANVLFALIIAYCIHHCKKTKASKSQTFAVVSTAGSVYILVTLLFVVYDVYGNVNPETVRTAVDSAADIFGKTYRIMLETASGGSKDPEVLRMIRDFSESMVLSVTASIPSAVVIFAMAFSALSVLIYKPVVRAAGMMSECFDGRNWNFGMSKVSAIVFELVYVAYIFVMLFSDSLVLNSALMNIISVLTVPFAYIGIRHFYGIIRKKVQSRVMSVIIIAAVLFFLMMLTGGTMIFTFVALVGSSVEFKKDYVFRQ